MTSSPFPGMDPYLEQLWGDIHTTLIVNCRDQINERLPADLQARVEETLSYAEQIRVPLQEPLPRIGIPLRETDADIALDLQPLLDECYRKGRYSSMDYSVPLEPPLSAEDQAWVEQLLAQHGNDRASSKCDPA